MSWLRSMLVLLVLLILSTPSVRAEDAQPGLLTVMFESIEFKRPTGLKVMEQVNVDTGYKVNDYSRVWIGHLRAPASGQIELFAEADDGLRLDVSGKRIIDGWDPGSARSGKISATKDQLLPLKLEYFQNGGQGFMKLYWSWPGQARQLIPASALVHTSEDKAEAEKVMKAGGPIVPEPIAPASPDTPDYSAIYTPGQTSGAAEAVPARPGPHLLVDDALIASSRNITRAINHPAREPSIPNPVVTAKGDGCFQPYMTISRSPETGRFRIWYGIATPDQNTSASLMAYMESTDGVNWIRPHRIVDSGMMQFGSEVLDRGPYWPDASQRYVYSHWYGGLRIEVSPDGLHFKPLADKPVIAHNHDINSVAWDSLRQRYVATMSSFMQHPKFKGARRTTMQSYSTDLLNWSPPVLVLVADDKFDEGQTQFYAMEGFVNRGPLRIGMVKILRDDLFSDTPEVLKQRGADFGIGYTTLAWTRDGEHWTRDREVFLDRGPLGSWDRSHTWIDEQVIVGDEVYLYYGGYRSGHKANRFDDRQIGLVKIPLDRYVARVAGAEAGALLTVPLKLDEQSQRLLVNANASGGELKVQLRDAKTNAPIDGLKFADCAAVTVDGLRSEIRWGDEAQTQRKLASLQGRAVQVEFELKNAKLYAFEFAEGLDSRPPVAPK